MNLPEYGMNSIDPYFYRRGIFRYANEGLQGGLLIKNMQINGISRMYVKNFNGNFTNDGLRVKLSFEIKPLQANGEFKADVKFGGLRLVPKGPFNITIGKVTVLLSRNILFYENPQSLSSVIFMKIFPDSLRVTLLTDGEFINTEEGTRIQLKRLNANVAVGNTRIIADGIFSDRNLSKYY